MSIIKIAEIKDRVGTSIPSISGTIVAVFPSKSGKGQHGQWKLQNIKIQDETGDCQVTLSGIDQDLNDSHKGKNIEFESVGTKFGLKGVTCEQRAYVDKKGNNVSTIGVKVTKTAKIRLEGAGMVQESPDDIPMTETEARGVAIIHKPDVDTVLQDYFKPNSSSKSPQERIAQFGKLYTMCLIQAIKMDETKDCPLSTSDVKDIASCLFIQSVREGLADKMDVDGKDPF